MSRPSAGEVLARPGRSVAGVQAVALLALSDEGAPVYDHDNAVWAGEHDIVTARGAGGL